MRLRLSVCMIVTLLLLGPAATFADGGRLTIGADTGAFLPFFEYEDSDKFEQSLSWNYGLHISYGVSDHASLQAGWLYTSQSALIDGDKTVGLIVQNISLTNKWNLLTGPFRPQLDGGVAYYIVDAGQPVEDDSAFGIHLGAGMEFVITRNLAAGFSLNTEYLFAHHYDKMIGTSALAFFNFTF